MNRRDRRAGARTTNPRKSGEIPMSAAPALGPDSAEVARIWVTDGQGSTVLIDAGVLADPEMFGVLMADTIRHAAIAHARALGMEEAEAAALIWRGLDGARPEPNRAARRAIAKRKLN